jgi:hypothetical protein
MVATESCGAPDDCERHALFVRTNETSVLGVRDPLQLDHGAKKGGWQRGSLTPRLPMTRTLTSARTEDAGGRERRPMTPLEMQHDQRVPERAARSPQHANMRLELCESHSHWGERCSRVCVPPAFSSLSSISMASSERRAVGPEYVLLTTRDGCVPKTELVQSNRETEGCRHP